MMARASQLFKKFLYFFIPNRRKNVDTSGVGTGLLEAAPDSRDYLATGTITSFPESFSLVGSGLTKVENQGVYNSCTAQAITTSVETYSKNYGYPHTLESSRMHVWNEGRKLSGTFPNNQGVYIRDGWKAIQKSGMTIEQLFPYTSENFNQELGLAATFFRQWYQPFKYLFIIGDNDSRKLLIKNVVFNHKVPVVFGIRISSQFVVLRALSDYVYKPESTERLTTAHAMTIIGFDETKKAFLIRNSWGTTWGYRGNVWADEEWVLNNGFDFSYPDAI